MRARHLTNIDPTPSLEESVEQACRIARVDVRVGSVPPPKFGPTQQTSAVALYLYGDGLTDLSEFWMVFNACEKAAGKATRGSHA